MNHMPPQETIQWRYDTQAIPLYYFLGGTSCNFGLKMNMLNNVIHNSPRNDQKLP